MVIIDSEFLLNELTDTSYSVSEGDERFFSTVINILLVQNNDGQWLVLNKDLPICGCDPNSAALEVQLKRIEEIFDFENNNLLIDGNRIHFEKFDYLGDYYAYWAQGDIIDRLKIYIIKSNKVELSENAKFVDYFNLKDLITKNDKYYELWDEFLKNKI